MYGSESVELVILRLAQRYNVMPSDVLDQPVEWITMMLMLEHYDLEKAKMELRRNANRKENSIKG